MGGQELEAGIPKLQSWELGCAGWSWGGGGFVRADTNLGKKTALLPLLPSRTCTSPGGSLQEGSGESSHSSTLRAALAVEPSTPDAAQAAGQPCRASSYLLFAGKGQERRARKYRAPHSHHALAESSASRFVKLKSNISPQKSCLHCQG